MKVINKTHHHICISLHIISQVNNEPLRQKKESAYAKPKAQISYRVTVQLASACDSTIIIPLLLKPIIPCLLPTYATVLADLCRTWSETKIVVFQNARV